jgi:hypothetical protein
MDGVLKVHEIKDTAMKDIEVGGKIQTIPHFLIKGNVEGSEVDDYWIAAILVKKADPEKYDVFEKKKSELKKQKRDKKRKRNQDKDLSTKTESKLSEEDTTHQPSVRFEPIVSKDDKINHTPMPEIQDNPSLTSSIVQPSPQTPSIPLPSIQTLVPEQYKFAVPSTPVASSPNKLARILDWDDDDEDLSQPSQKQKLDLPLSQEQDSSQSRRNSNMIDEYLKLIENGNTFMPLNQDIYREYEALKIEYEKSETYNKSLVDLNNQYITRIHELENHVLEQNNIITNLNSKVETSNNILTIFGSIRSIFNNQEQQGLHDLFLRIQLYVQSFDAMKSLIEDVTKEILPGGSSFQ